MPEPEAPVRTVIHETLETADHAQPPGIATSTLPLAPVAATFWVAGVSVASHGAPAWVRTKPCPATVSVADREALLLFAATTYPTLPLLVPEVGVENMIQLTGLCAVHEQLEPAVMPILPVADVDGTDALVGVML